MTKTKLNELLAENGMSVVPGYNYEMLSVRMDAQDVSTGVTLFRTSKVKIEREYRKLMKSRGLDGSIKLLPEVCVPRAASILVPLPVGCAVNVVSKALGGLKGLPKTVRFPLWG